MVHDGSQREASVVNDNWRCSEVQNILILVLCVKKQHFQVVYVIKQFSQVRFI